MNRVSLFERQKLSKMVDNNLREYDRFLWARVQGESEEIVKSPKQSESNNNYFFAAFISYLLLGYDICHFCSGIFLSRGCICWIYIHFGIVHFSFGCCV